MRVLFVLENLADRCGANVNIAIVLVKQLAKYFEVDALVRYDQIKTISCEKKGSFSKVHTFCADQPGKLTEFTSKDWNELSIPAKIMQFSNHPNILVSMVDAKYFDFSITKRKCRKAIEEVCRKEKYDVVIAVSAPYYIMQAVAEANIDCKKMALQLDPFTNNYSLSPRMKNHRRRNELRTVGKMNMIFAGDYLWSDLQSVVSETHNIVKLPLPGLVVDDMKNLPKTVERKDQIVHFLFVGQFYEIIRNPHYLLELFTYLPSNYVLHIVGGGCDDEVKKYEKILGNRLVRHGWLSKDKANAYMEQFDVLINVNNTISNQLPSKLFEYISTGKPILNICKSSKCLSNPYLNKYLNGVSVVEDTELFAYNANSIKQFIEERLQIILSKEEILDSFWENSDVYVAELIRNKLQETASNVKR